MNTLDHGGFQCDGIAASCCAGVTASSIIVASRGSFGDVTPHMRIAREEVFGPVLSIMSYDTEDEAIDIANDTPFGLAGFVQSKDPNRARAVANRIRAGSVYLNGAPFDRSLPFGGYKQSGNGREFGVFGFEEYLEVKAILG